MSPFNSAIYKRLMKGLEITEVKISKLFAENPTKRIDSEYFQKRYINNVATIEAFSAGWVRLGDRLKELTGGATPLGANYPKDGVRFLRVQNIMPNFIDDSDIVYISDEDDKTLSRSRLKKNDVLLTITGVSYGKSAVVTNEFANSNINQHSVRMELQSGAFEPLFISTFLNSSLGKLQSDQNVTGVTRPALDYEAIRRFRIPLVSKDFQKAIAQTVRIGQQKFSEMRKFFAKAEEEFLVSVGLGNWQPPSPLSYTYQASEVFTERRLDAEHFQPKYNAMIDTMHSFGIQTKPLGEIIEPVISGIDCRDFIPDGIPYIRVGDIRDGRLFNENAKKINLALDEISKEIKLLPGDVLFTRKGSYGNAAIVRLGQQNCIISTEIIRLRITPTWQDKLLPEYLSSYFNSLVGSYQAEKWAHGVAFYSITQDDLYKFEVPIPSIKAQKNIRKALNDSEKTLQHANELLENAKRAVEIAIGKNEAEALVFLDSILEK